MAPPRRGLVVEDSICVLLVRDPREGLGEDVGGVLGARDVDDLDGA